MMRLQEFVLPGNWHGQMVEVIELAVILIILLVIGSYACSRAVALAWFRTKLEFVRSVLREGSPNGGEK
jgi:hypothetical protein